MTVLDHAELRYRLAVFLLFLTGAIVLIHAVLANRPFNGFEDDAYWLVPSLAYDLESGESWAEQVSKDTGERGAISLNALLRSLYLIFGTNATSYIITGTLLHTACSFALLLAMRECGTEQWTGFLATAGFLFSSMQFHAYFWIIGMQHVLVVISLLITFIVVNRLMRACFDRPLHAPSMSRYVISLTMLFALSFNRASILISLIVIALIFLYYRFDHVQRPDHASRSLRNVYVLAMLAAPVYEILQMARSGEGWQIAAFLVVFARLGSQSEWGIRFLTLYSGYALLVLASDVLFELAARYVKRHMRWRLTEVIYFGSIGLVILAALYYDRQFQVLSALAENLFFVMDDVTSVTRDWAMINAHEFPNAIAQPVNALVYLVWVAIFIYARPQQKEQQILSAVWFVAVAVGLAYAHSLMSGSLHLSGIPSRYVYYFSPALFMSIAFAARRFFSTHLKAAARVALMAGYGLFIVLNVPALHLRLVNSTTAFMNDGDGQYSMDLAESIAGWIHKTGHTGDVKLNTAAFKPKQWEILAEYIPPASSGFYPLFFSAQAFLSQILHEDHTRIRVVDGPADLFMCGRGICEAPASRD
jgi:hypothetical protein